MQKQTGRSTDCKRKHRAASADTPVVAEEYFGAVVKDRGSKLGRTTYTEKWKDTVLQTHNSINWIQRTLEKYYPYKKRVYYVKAEHESWRMHSRFWNNGMLSPNITLEI